MAMCENWQVFVHDGRYNYAIGVYTHGHAQAAKLTEEQMIQTEQFRKSHVPPRNILRFFQEQNIGFAIIAQKIYNAVAKIKKNRMQGYTIPLLEVVGMTPTETTNRAESEHSVLKLWLSTCHGDLDTVFLNIDSLIESQIADIKASLEFSRTKEKFNAKSNQIFFIISNKISHLALKKIWSEIPRAVELYDDPKNKCRHYLKTSHGLPCAYELITRFDHVLPIQLSEKLAVVILQPGNRTWILRCVL
ncbi:hypothetical protein M9H77_17407 [Catharanthus roseus]|uniref:Uncharacterized protein n=1 Tax=Catharanthus roseus TaxID=4058 RepID=A0ACC0B4J7_CATRO|nr:hypothetical protein M9H77_17407 [Catharanthus roseus]